MTKVLPKFYSPFAVGKRLRVEARTVKRWCDRGRMRHTKTPAGEYKIPAEAFAAFCAEFGLRDWTAEDGRPADA